MAAVKYEFSIGALKAFYSIVFPDILLVYISRNAVSENKTKSAPKVSSKCPFKAFFHLSQIPTRELSASDFIQSQCSTVFQQDASTCSELASGFAISVMYI